MTDAEFKKLSRDVAKASEAYGALLAKWFEGAQNFARRHDRNDIEGGMSDQRLRDRLKIHVLASLPKDLMIEGSGEARRYLRTHPALPGLE